MLIIKLIFLRIGVRHCTIEYILHMLDIDDMRKYLGLF